MDIPDLANIFNDEPEVVPVHMATADSLPESLKLNFDPFLLQGDEQTWDMVDWNWDPYSLSAVPKDTTAAAPCCQALKKRKTADSTTHKNGGQHAGQQHGAPHYSQGAPNFCNTSTNASGGCCSFQMPQAAAQPHPQPNVMNTWGMSMAPYSEAMWNQAAMMASVQSMQLAAMSAPAMQSTVPAAQPMYSSAATPMGQGHLVACIPTPNPAETSQVLGSTHASYESSLDAKQEKRGYKRDDSGSGCCSKAHVSKRESIGQKPKDEDSDLELDGLESGDEGGIPKTAARYDGSLEGVVALHDCPEDSHKMTCQVAGCGKDLTNLKEYHQRYRICEIHIKLPQVVKDGRLQRFCQQCGRFHDLSAFDGNRKSCREQLSKHNARRRRRAQIEQQKAKAAENAAPAVLEDKSDVGKFLATLMHNPTQLHALRLLLGVQTNPALPPLQPYTPEQPVTAHVDSADVTEPASYTVARDILKGQGDYNAHFESDHKVMRISMKLFNRTPSDLPQDLKQQIVSWLGSSPAGMEGYIRPGCVFLTLNLLVDQTTYSRAMAAGVQSLLAFLLHKTGCMFWWQGTYAVQLGEEMGMVANGSVTAVHTKQGYVQLDGSATLYPHLSASSGQCVLSIKSGAVVQLTGEHLNLPGCELVCRWQGKQLRPKLQGVSEDGTHASLSLPELSGCGLMMVEVARGAWMSEAIPVLVVDEPALAAELSNLDGHLAPEAVESLLVDLALVLQHVQSDICSGGLDHHSIAIKARRLLAFACDKGWAAAAARVLPLATAECSCATEMVAAIHASSNSIDGLSLLHRAVRSGNLALIQGMLHWGRVHGYQWRADRRGPFGITPLHLAALMEEPRLVLSLLDHCPQGAFTRLQADDGATPFHLAFQMGHFMLDQLLQMLNSPGMPLNIKQQQQQACNSKSKRHQSHASQQQLKELDPCEVCHSTLPPLMLSILASCTDCGSRVPCLNTSDACSGHEKSCCAGCVANNHGADCGEHSEHRSMKGRLSHLSPPLWDVNNMAEGVSELDCSHTHGLVYSITAMCQSCHSNRVMEVA